MNFVVLACGLVNCGFIYYCHVRYVSYMALLMFYGLACLSFFRCHSYGFRSLSMYFPIDYFHFQNYRNIGAVFVSDNIVSISFSKKKYENESDLASY